jgi:retron-type reverse transcriptase
VNTAAGDHIAVALADAYLATPNWRRPDLRAATRVVLGVAPRWISAVLDDILRAYPRKPMDRPRELARFIAGLPSLRAHVPGAPDAKPMRVRVRMAVPTRTVRNPFHTRQINDVGALAAFLGLTIEELDWYADPRGMNRRAGDRRLQHYRHLWLNGRLIEAPKPRLRALQRQVLSELIGEIPTHPAAHGFVPGRSPHTFAAPHAGRPTVIRLDVTSFFASVTAARVYGLLRSAGYPEPVAYTVTALCTIRTPVPVLRTAALTVPDREYRLALLRAPHLPQGAPTSPALANLCGFRLDRRLTGLAGAFDARYTRYADDLAFSGTFTPRGATAFIARVTAIAAESGFRINTSKTRVRGAGDRQALAGLVVNAAPAVPRDEYDALRALLHNAARTGIDAQNRDGHADFAQYLAGRVAWVAHRHSTRAAKLAALLASALDVTSSPI